MCNTRLMASTMYFSLVFNRSKRKFLNSVLFHVDICAQFQMYLHWFKEPIHIHLPQVTSDRQHVCAARFKNTLSLLSPDKTRKHVASNIAADTFPGFATQEALFLASKYVSASRQKHIPVRLNLETLGNICCGNMFPCFARALDHLHK